MDWIRSRDKLTIKESPHFVRPSLLAWDTGLVSRIVRKVRTAAARWSDDRPAGDETVASSALEKKARTHQRLRQQILSWWEQLAENIEGEEEGRCEECLNLRQRRLDMRVGGLSDEERKALRRQRAELKAELEAHRDQGECQEMDALRLDATRRIEAALMVNIINIKLMICIIMSQLQYIL